MNSRITISLIEAEYARLKNICAAMEKHFVDRGMPKTTFTVEALAATVVAQGIAEWERLYDIKPVTV